VTPVTERAPVIVLASPDSGAQRLLSLLSAGGGLACTSGTGVLPLCEQAAHVWRRAETGNGQTGRLSSLAAKSIRTSVAPLVTQILASTGAQRWCEHAAPAPSAAGTFLGLFPGTRFVCLHREAGQVIRAALARSPWGLAGPAYRPFVAAQPGSSVAALAAYWAAHTEALLEFEAGHPDACLRVRFEDLPGMPGQIPAELSDFLGIAAVGYQGPPARHDDGDTAPGEEVPPPPALPLDQVPPPLLTQVNGLLSQLGYPALVPG
jgi:hypothetical protein